MGVSSLIALMGIAYALAYTAECTTPYSRSVNDVGFSITKRLGGKGNLMISPVSIYATMAMLCAGSKGQTRKQILEGLNVNWRGVDIVDFFLNSQYIAKSYNGKQEGYSLSMGNGMFVQEGFQLRGEFRQYVIKDFGGTVENVDFAGKGRKAMQTINDWAANKTGNMIRDLLKQPLDESTQLALLNAIHFKGTWEKRFNASQTKEGIFFNNSSRPGVYKAQFMEMRREKFNFLIDPITKYKFLEMPYKSGHTTMIVALPIDETNFPDLDMTEETLYRVTRKMRKEVLDRVVLPKFSFDYNAELKDHLEGMGVKDLFTSRANLTVISESGRLKVSSIFHNTAIEVNEEGSKASGVTGVVVVPTSLVQPKRSFIADHPFLFYILDFNTDIVLFSGRVVNP